MNKATVVEGDPKAPFSIATTPRCREGHYFLLYISPLYFWYLPYNPECLANMYQVPFFCVFGMTRPGIELLFPKRNLYPLGYFTSVFVRLCVCVCMWTICQFDKLYLYIPST